MLMTNHRCYFFGANAAAALLVSSTSSLQQFFLPPRSMTQQQRRGPFFYSRKTMMTTTELYYSNDAISSYNNSWIIQWRGEGTEGYSNSLRQLEFMCAFRAEMKEYLQSLSSQYHQNQEFITNNNANAAEGVHFHFRDALSFSSKSTVYNETVGVDAVDDDEDTKNISYNHHPPTSQIHAYESGLQYVTITNLSSSIAAAAPTIESIFKNTIERCSLIRTAYQIVAESLNHNNYKDLANIAIKNNAFHDLIMVDNAADETPPTWSIRLRRYGIRTTIDENSHTQTTARFGKNVRSSLRQEYAAILDMKELVQQFRGRVELVEPMCKIYILDGLQSFFFHNDQQQQIDNNNNNSSDNSSENNNVKTNKLLTRVVASGPKTSIYAPKTRLCITRTPLCPIASFTLCNVAQIQSNCTILDPFAGSVLHSWRLHI
jgi:hypothetical protein